MGNQLINKSIPFEEGEILIKWILNRIKANKNCLIVTTGSTGSGKSYNDLRKAEILYKKRFNENFPIDNCCFSVSEFMIRLSSGKLRKGEVLILEESGVNLGSADWQNKVVKTFNYILQSFRSMNIVVLFNLPVLGMLSKQARQLIHMHCETQGVDKETDTIKMKALIHQLNQSSGKSYWKFMRVKYKGHLTKVTRMCFGLPSKTLRDQYESKKMKFLTDITTEFSNELRKKEREKLEKLNRNDLSEAELLVFKLLQEDKKQVEIAKILNKSTSTINSTVKRIKKKGFEVILLEKSENQPSNLQTTPV